MQQIDEFVDELLTQKGVNFADPSIREEIKQNTKQRLEDRINEDVLSRLSTEQAEELANLMDDPSFDEQKLFDYVEGAGVDIDASIQETMNNFRNFYLTGGQQ